MKKRRSPQPRPAKAEAPFYQPFRGLEPPRAPPPPQKKKAPAPPPPPREAPDETELFLAAVEGAVPLEDRASPPPPPNIVPRVVSDDAEALAELADLVSGRGEFDLSQTEEFIEGTAPDVDRRVLRALKRGEYAVQAHLDLHGMTRAQAHEAVEAFIEHSRKHKQRCVLLVHGRGLNSKDQIPVLKEQLKVWLKRGQLGRSVLAFATARPHDGGAGALYVLLRRLR